MKPFTHRLLPLLFLLGCNQKTAKYDNVTLDSSYLALEMLKDSAPEVYPAYRAAFVIAVQAGLSRMGFGPAEFSGQIDAATKHATQLYERMRGLPETGNPFSEATYKRLMADLERQEYLANPITRRDFTDISWSNGYFKANGPWLFEGVEKPEAATIECFRASRDCIVASTGGGLEPRIPGIDHFDIRSWDSAEIVSGSSGACARSVLRINRVQQSVSIVSSLTSKSGICESMGSDTSFAHDQVAHLASTSETESIARRFTRALWDSVFNLTPSLRQSMAILLDTARLRAAFNTARLKGGRQVPVPK